ncbi:MAG: hypothetical protein WBL65_20590 [Bryobacteraceae bacterium]
MRVLLVSSNTERTAIIPLRLGPAFVAAACRRAGHETVLRYVEPHTQRRSRAIVRSFAAIV